MNEEVIEVTKGKFKKPKKEYTKVVTLPLDKKYNDVIEEFLTVDYGVIAILSAIAIKNRRRAIFPFLEEFEAQETDKNTKKKVFDEDGNPVMYKYKKVAKVPLLKDFINEYVLKFLKDQNKPTIKKFFEAEKEFELLRKEFFDTHGRHPGDTYKDEDGKSGKMIAGEKDLVEVVLTDKMLGTLLRFIMGEEASALSERYFKMTTKARKRGYLKSIEKAYKVSLTGIKGLKIELLDEIMMRLASPSDEVDNLMYRYQKKGFARKFMNVQEDQYEKKTKMFIAGDLIDHSYTSMLKNATNRAGLEELHPKYAEIFLKRKISANKWNSAIVKTAHSNASRKYIEHINKKIEEGSELAPSISISSMYTISGKKRYYANMGFKTDLKFLGIFGSNYENFESKYEQDKNLMTVGIDYGSRNVVAVASTGDCIASELLTRVSVKRQATATKIQKVMSKCSHKVNKHKMVDGVYPKGTKFDKSNIEKKYQYRLKGINRATAQLRNAHHAEVQRKILKSTAQLIVEVTQVSGKKAEKNEIQDSGVKMTKELNMDQKVANTKRRRTFGRTISNFATMGFQAGLEEKALKMQIPVIVVSQDKYKASQLYIEDGELKYRKKELKERYDDKCTLQRDFGSAYALSHARIDDIFNSTMDDKSRMAKRKAAKTGPTEPNIETYQANLEHAQRVCKRVEEQYVEELSYVLKNNLTDIVSKNFAVKAAKFRRLSEEERKRVTDFCNKRCDNFMPISDVKAKLSSK